MIDYLRSSLGKQSDLILVLLVVGILMILFTPIPPALLDVLIILNLAFGLLILLMTFYVEKPIQFSTFPSLLLIATLFRLSLNIAATRLILSEGDAGQVIGAIGEYVVSGNYVIGLIVFIVLIVVQYVVVTNGAQRVAEVAARFTLDSMPGKQMSIDADLNVGIIDEKQAQARRKEIEKEGSFYGAMDGASKFVKGDAIAGIIVILIDIIGGLTIGIAQLGMSWGDAMQTYTLLTIGDGIVTQIPALIISTGTGIIVTRAASGDSLGTEISKQIIEYPKTLILIVGGLFLLLLLPGLPAFPIFIVISLVSLLIWAAFKFKDESYTADESGIEKEETDIYSEIKVDPVLVELSVSLAGLIGGENNELMDQISKFRKNYAMASGFVLPQVIIKEDSKLEEGAYRIQIYGVEVGEDKVYMDSVLAIDPGNAKTVLEGIDTKDPSFGLPAKWVKSNNENTARNAGYTVVDLPTVVLTHITEILKQNVTDLLTRKEVESLVASVRRSNSSLVDELIPGVMNTGLIKKVLSYLLSESVPIRNLERILEVLLDEGRNTSDPIVLSELVRQSLSSVIFQSVSNKHKELQVLVLDREIEKTVVSSLNEGRLNLDPRYAEQLMVRVAAQVEKMLRAGLSPTLICSAEIRYQVGSLLRRAVPQLTVMSMGEIPNTGSVKSFAVVTI